MAQPLLSELLTHAFAPRRHILQVVDATSPHYLYVGYPVKRIDSRHRLPNGTVVPVFTFTLDRGPGVRAITLRDEQLRVAPSEIQTFGRVDYEHLRRFNRLAEQRATTRKHDKALLDSRQALALFKQQRENNEEMRKLATLTTDKAKKLYEKLKADKDKQQQRLESDVVAKERARDASKRAEEAIVEPPDESLFLSFFERALLHPSTLQKTLDDVRTQAEAEAKRAYDERIKQIKADHDRRVQAIRNEHVEESEESEVPPPPDAPPDTRPTRTLRKPTMQYTHKRLSEAQSAFSNASHAAADEYNEHPAIKRVADMEEQFEVVKSLVKSSEPSGRLRNLLRLILRGEELMRASLRGELTAADRDKSDALNVPLTIVRKVLHKDIGPNILDLPTNVFPERRKLRKFGANFEPGFRFHNVEKKVKLGEWDSISGKIPTLKDIEEHEKNAAARYAATATGDLTAAPRLSAPLANNVRRLTSQNAATARQAPAAPRMLSILRDEVLDGPPVEGVAVAAPAPAPAPAPPPRAPASSPREGAPLLTDEEDEKIHLYREALTDFLKSAAADDEPLRAIVTHTHYTSTLDQQQSKTGFVEGMEVYLKSVMPFHADDPDIRITARPVRPAVSSDKAFRSVPLSALRIEPLTDQQQIRWKGVLLEAAKKAASRRRKMKVQLNPALSVVETLAECTRAIAARKAPVVPKSFQRTVFDDRPTIARVSDAAIRNLAINNPDGLAAVLEAGMNDIEADKGVLVPTLPAPAAAPPPLPPVRALMSPSPQAPRVPVPAPTPDEAASVASRKTTSPHTPAGSPPSVHSHHSTSSSSSRTETEENTNPYHVARYVAPPTMPELPHAAQNPNAYIDEDWAALIAATREERERDASQSPASQLSGSKRPRSASSDIHSTLSSVFGRSTQSAPLPTIPEEEEEEAPLPAPPATPPAVAPASPEANGYFSDDPDWEARRVQRAREQLALRNAFPNVPAPQPAESEETHFSVSSNSSATPPWERRTVPQERSFEEGQGGMRYDADEDVGGGMSWSKAYLDAHPELKSRDMTEESVGNYLGQAYDRAAEAEADPYIKVKVGDKTDVVKASQFEDTLNKRFAESETPVQRGFRAANTALAGVAGVAKHFLSPSMQFAASFIPDPSQHFRFGGSLEASFGRLPSATTAAEAKDLSGTEVSSKSGGCRVVTYPNLAQFASWDALASQPTAVLFLTTSPETGHWLAAFNGPDGAHVFDPLGVALDKERSYIGSGMQQQLGETQPQFHRLLQGVPVHVSKMDFQRDAPNVNTCGRWTALRLRNRTMTDPQFKAYVLQSARADGFKDLDEWVTTQ